MAQNGLIGGIREPKMTIMPIPGFDPKLSLTPAPAPGQGTTTPTLAPRPAPSPIPIWNPGAPLLGATAQNYSATNAAAKDMTATGAASRDMTADERTVDRPTGTVQGQLDSFLGSGSPVMERARAGAMQQANSRGLINSTMAAQAGEAAALDVAVPVAQADANIYNQVAGQNQQFKNQAASQNAQLGTQVNMANADAENRAASQNAQLGTQTNMANADAANKAAAQGAQLGTQTSQINAELTLKEQMAREQNNTQIVMANADAATKTELANIEAQYKVLMQGNVSATDIYKSSMANISSILMSPDLDGPAKNAAILQQLALLKNGMAMVGGINAMQFTDASGNQVGLEDLLDFSEGGAGGLGGIAQPIESPALIGARNAMEAAQAALNSAMTDMSGSRRLRAARQAAARAELARTKAIYEQAAAVAAQAPPATTPPPGGTPA